MISLLEERIEAEASSQSKMETSFTRENLPYNIGTIYSTKQTYTESFLENGSAVAFGHKKYKRTLADGSVELDIDADFTKKHAKDDTYYYDILDYDTTSTDYNFKDKASRKEISSLSGLELTRAKGDFISGAALDLISYLFPSYSTTLSALPSFKYKTVDGNDVYTAKVTVSNSGADENGEYKENYYYELNLAFSSDGNLTKVDGKKSWQYFLTASGSSKPDKYQYDTFSCTGEYGSKPTSVEHDINVLDYFLTSYSGIQLSTYSNAKYEVMDPTKLNRGVYISRAEATGYAPSKAVDVFLIPVSSSNTDVVRIDSTNGLFYVNPVYGTSTLTFKSVTGIEKSIEVTTSESKPSPDNLNINMLSRVKFEADVQTYDGVKYMYLGREYKGLTINITNAVKFDDRIDYASSDESVIKLEEVKYVEPSSSSSVAKRTYDATPLKEGEATISFYAKENHDVKKEFTYVVKQGLTPDQLKARLEEKTWSFYDPKENQTIDMNFKNGKVNATSTVGYEVTKAYASYTLDDYKITFGTWYTEDGEEAYSVYSEGEMSIAGEDIRLCSSTGSVATGDKYLPKESK